MKIIFTLLLLIQFFYAPEIYTQNQPNKSNQIIWDAEHSAYIPDWLNPIQSKRFKDFAFNIHQTVGLHKFNKILEMDSIIATSLQGEMLKLLFKYDSDGKITEQLELFNDSYGWSNSTILLYKYDKIGNLIQQLLLGWYVSDWDSLMRINYTYNSQGDEYQYIFQGYSQGEWVNSSRSTINYDSNGNESTRLVEYWQNDKWVNRLLLNSYYSKLVERDSLVVQIWGYNEWQNYSKTYFYYDRQTGYLEYLFAKFWTGINWQNNVLRTIKNDLNGNQIEQDDDTWNGSAWEKSVRRFYTYNSLNYIEDAYCELWDGNNWISGEEVILIDNPDGFRASFITYRVTIYYKTTSVNENITSAPQDFTLSQNYPNPFNPTTKIKFTIPVGTRHAVSVQLRVYDVLGNEIATLVNEEIPAGSYEVEFNATGLTSGIYLYKLQTENYYSIKKMIYLK